MTQPTSVSTFPTIPTNLSATYATHPNNNNSSPTLSSLIRMQASFCPDDLFNSPLLPTYADENDFQSNSRVQNDSGSLLSYPPLNGLGIYYSGPSGFFKTEDATEQELLPPSAPVGRHALLLNGESSSFARHAHNALPFNLDALGSPFFTDVCRFLNSFEDEKAVVHQNADHQGSLSLSSSSSSANATYSMDEELSDIAFNTSCSSLAESSSQFAGGGYKTRSPSPAVVGPFADINMFNLAYLNRAPEAGINPADTMGPVPFPALTDTNVAFKPLSSPTTNLLSGDTLPATAELPSADVMDSIVSMLSNSVTEQSRTLQPPGSNASRSAIPKRKNLFRDQSRINFNVYGHDGRIWSPEAELVNRFATAPPAAQRSPLVELLSPSNQQTASPSPCYGDTHCSPVLNAHLGVDLSHLLEKADNYRKRYPGCELDKKWLMAYAGKLSVRGEMLDDYRCYVNGCTQKNKRRDHILVHVGSHVDQRPFACDVCPMRFLRKNECKRHEAGHTGERPYLCEVCEEKSFVRQDLLKRHLKRAHGIGITEDRRSSKKVKLE